MCIFLFQHSSFPLLEVWEGAVLLARSQDAVQVMLWNLPGGFRQQVLYVIHRCFSEHDRIKHFCSCRGALPAAEIRDWARLIRPVEALELAQVSLHRLDGNVT